MFVLPTITTLVGVQGRRVLASATRVWATLILFLDCALLTDEMRRGEKKNRTFSLSVFSAGYLKCVWLRTPGRPTFEFNCQTLAKSVCTHMCVESKHV